MNKAIPLAIDLFVSFDQSGDGHNLALDLKVRFEDNDFYLDDAMVIEPSIGIYSRKKHVAPTWMWRLIEADEGILAAAQIAWAEEQARLGEEAADYRREERRFAA